MKERIGLVAFWKHYDRQLNLRAARLADELGYHSFWVPEAWGYDSTTLLTEMALCTRQIQLGTGILNVFSRSPGLIAMTAATLDEVSNGRFILGLGTSGKKVIEGLHGRPFVKPLTQVRDVIRVVRTLLAGGTLNDAQAELTEYRPFKLELTSARPALPIYVAALRPKALESIGELADGWIPIFWPYDRLHEGRAHIEVGARRAGRDPAQIVTAPFTTVLPLGEEAMQAARRLISFYIGGMGEYYIELLRQFGFADACERIADLYRDKATREQAAAAVSPAMIESLTIAGDPEHCIEELQRRRSFGIDLPLLNLPSQLPWELVERFIRVMAPRA